ncbi:MAG: phosphosulfolactate synthase [Bacteroidetes bacterium]|nr:MAG: phosphosulfolactate synthase [Bacteroidota bacterium]
MSILNYLPERSEKPRNSGINMVMDKGIGMNQAHDVINTCGFLIDFMKLGFGTSYVNPNVKDKIRLYKKYGIKVYPGGTLFEAFVIRNQFDDFLKFLDKMGYDAVEVSDGSMKMNHDDKCNYIERLSNEFTVLSEVGSKQAGVEMATDVWANQMKTEREAGAFKVIAEARESGTVGIYDSTGKPDFALIDILTHAIPMDDIIWEAPQKSQQAWFIKHFGANVNLGNIAPTEVIPLETLRLGLRGDTFFEPLPENLKR